MDFPKLVLKQFCKTPVKVTVYGEGITEDGAPVVIFECRKVYPSFDLFPSDTFFAGEIRCNYQDKSKTVFDAQKKIVKTSGVILIPGDIAPNFPTLSGGYVLINGVKRDIVQGVKARNPDGTVNFTELDVI